MIYKIQNINELNIDEISTKVSAKRLERSAKFKADQDKKRSVAVEYLLNEMLSECYEGIQTPVDLDYDDKGKPHVYIDESKTDNHHERSELNLNAGSLFSDHEGDTKENSEDSAISNCKRDVLSNCEFRDNHNTEIHFSLSHSGEYVACMISDRPCGIDIEKHSEKRDYEKIAKRICTENELMEITDKSSFYSFWTLKESVLKAVGLGLALDMRKVEITKGQDEYIAVVDEKKYIGGALEAPDGYSLSYVEAM